MRPFVVHHVVGIGAGAGDVRSHHGEILVVRHVILAGYPDRVLILAIRRHQKLQRVFVFQDVHHSGLPEIDLELGKTLFKERADLFELRRHAAAVMFAGVGINRVVGRFDFNPILVVLRAQGSRKCEKHQASDTHRANPERQLSVHYACMIACAGQGVNSPRRAACLAMAFRCQRSLLCFRGHGHRRDQAVTAKPLTR